MNNKPTLFLDRDGVINRRSPGDYIKHPTEFVPESGALEAIRLLSPYFDRIIVVTNQAGIGKGLMDESDLEAIHNKMIALIAAAGGRVDRVYYCPHLPDAGCTCRKPATGMALAAREDFPDIDFSHSWMVGDSASDIQLGQHLGMKTVLIAGKFEDTEALESLMVDCRFESLLEFAVFVDSGAMC